MSELFAEVFARDNYRCVYCRRDLMVDFETFMIAQEDHLVPTSKHGPHKTANIVISCANCHRLRGNYAPADEYSEEKRASYIASIRSYIISRRAENMKLTN